MMSIGLGFTVRDESQQDIEDDIDIDGEDEALYGVAQFTEGDVLCSGATANTEDEDVEIEGDNEAHPVAGTSGSVGPSMSPPTLQELAADGQVTKKGSVTEHDYREAGQAVDEAVGVTEVEELDKAIDLARKSGNAAALIESLENKVKLLVC